MQLGPRVARVPVLGGLIFWCASAVAQPAIVRTSLSAADPDPGAEEPELDVRALPLESRTDLLANVGLDTPGVLRLADGVGIYGGVASETRLMLDGVQVSRLSAPLAMLGNVQIHRAAYGATLADVPGGAVAAFTRPDDERWRASLDAFQDRQDPRTNTASVTVSGPVLKRRLHLLVGFQVGRDSFEQNLDPEGLLNAPAVSGRNSGGGLKLSFTPGHGQRIELLALGTMAWQENSPMLGRWPEAQPRWEDSYGLLALRWAGQFGRSWLARAQVAFEGSGTRLFPKQCLTEPDCYDIPPIINTVPRRFQSLNYELRSEQSLRATDMQLSVQRALPDQPRWQWAIRAGSRFRFGWRDRLWQMPGNQLDEYSGNVPITRTTYYANDPRLEPVAAMGPVRASWDTLRAVQFIELPIRIRSRLQILPGVALVAARAQVGEQQPAPAALTHHLAAEYDAHPPWQLRVRASTHRRADADLDVLDRLTAVAPVSRRCIWDGVTGEFDRECTYSGGRRASLGLPCGPAGVTPTGAPCRQQLGLPRTWEHTLGAGMDLGVGFRLDMDFIERRTSGRWARLETNRVWNIIGREASFEGYRNGRAEPQFDVSAPGGPSRTHRALTTAVQRPVGLATLMLAHTYSRTRIPLRPLPGLVIVDDDGGRHFVHLQSLLNLGGFGSIGIRFRYAQGETVLPVFGNSVTGVSEPFRQIGGLPSNTQSGVTPGTTLRQPAVRDLNFQLRLSLRQVIRVADAQLYADAMNVFPKGGSPRVSQQGIGLGLPRETWYRIGLQAGF